MGTSSCDDNDIPEAGPDFVQSLARGLRVLTSFDDDHPQLTLSEAAARTGLTRPTARRVLLTLQTLGYVRSDGRRFALTPKVLDIGYAYLSSLDLARIAYDEMQALVARTQESCSAAVLDGTTVVYVARVPTERIMAISLGLGSRLPAYATSMGRVLLAGLPADERRARLDSIELLALTDRTITDRGRLEEELDRIAEQGWALVDQELERGVRSVSAPLRDRQGQVVAAMNLGTNASRVSANQLRVELLPHLLASAARISERLAKR